NRRFYLSRSPRRRPWPASLSRPLFRLATGESLRAGMSLSSTYSRLSSVPAFLTRAGAARGSASTYRAGLGLRKATGLFRRTLGTRWRLDDIGRYLMFNNLTILGFGASCHTHSSNQDGCGPGKGQVHSASHRKAPTAPRQTFSPIIT